MAFSKAFTLSLLLGLAFSRPNFMEDLEASGMIEEGSGLQPRLDIMEEEGSGLQPRLDLMDEEGSGLQPRLDIMEEESSGLEPRLDIIEMNGSGLQDFKALNEEEEGSADFRMAELFEASGDDAETMLLLVKSFEEELGSGDLRSVEIGSAMEEEMSSAENGLTRSAEAEEEIEANTEAVVNVMASIDDREPKKKARLLAKFLSNVGSVVEEIVDRKQNLAEEALKVKLNLSQGIIDAKKDLVQHFI